MSVINPETYNAEVYTSAQVYGMVMPDALRLSPMNPESSAHRDALYKDIGVVPVQLESSGVYLRGHNGLVSNQTVQECGSYKVRGSGNAILCALEIDPDLTDIHIASAGNAAYGAVQASRPFGLRVTCEATTNASPAKIGSLRLANAVVHDTHKEFEDGREAAILLGEQQHHATIEAYDQVETIAGQATIGWETLSDLLGRASRKEINLHTDPIKLFVPVGGGGLISGIACVMKWAKDEGLIGRDNVQVIGVQMEGCDAMRRHVDYTRFGFRLPKDLFRSGLPFDPTCDGAAVRKPGKLTSAIVADPEFVADIIAVSPGEVGVAMEDTSRAHKVWVEPAGALSTAGAQRYARTFPFDRRRQAETLITFVTGANVSPVLRQQFFERAAEWREQRRNAETAALDTYRGMLLNLGNTGMKGVESIVRRPQLATHVRGTRVASSPVPRQAPAGALRSVRHSTS